MTTPAEALRHFAIALAMGAGLGVLYGFLRPVRKRLAHLSDLIFMIGFFWAWLHLGFGVCGGDLRLGCSSGLPCGILLWDKTVGKLLQPVFNGFWRLVGQIFRAFLYPWKIFFKKIGKTAKFLLASAKKAVTIKCNKKDGGIRHGIKAKPIEPDPAGISAQPYHAQVRAAGDAAGGYTGADGAAFFPAGDKGEN